MANRQGIKYHALSHYTGYATRIVKCASSTCLGASQRSDAIRSAALLHNSPCSCRVVRILSSSGFATDKLHWSLFGSSTSSWFFATFAPSILKPQLWPKKIPSGTPNGFYSQTTSAKLRTLQQMSETHHSSIRHQASSAQTTNFRVFISHAGEDKETIARPLWKRLRQHGLSVFLDDESFHLGEHCLEVMEHAMKTAPVGVFILSPEFVAKYWPMRELLTFVHRYDDAKATNETPPMLISVFYRFSIRQCRDPAIFDSYSNLFLRHGLFKRALDDELPLKDVKHALNMAATLWSIENDVGATNSNRLSMASTRESFIQIVESSILGHLGIKPTQLADKCHETECNQPAQIDVYTPCSMVPPNPPRLTLDYASPTTCEGKLRAAVLGNSGSRIASVVATGKGGVGKTCALRGLADVNEVKQRFREGILYIELGSDAALSNIVLGIATIVDWTGGSNLAKEIRTLKSVAEASEKASKWFSQRSCLFLVDDIWHVNGIDSDVLITLGLMVHTNSRMVYTTRDRHFLVEAAETIVFEEKETSGELSKEMLMRQAGFEQGTVLNNKNKDAFMYFLALCQGLPLGFGIVGSSVRLYSFDCQRRQDAWSALYHDVSSQQKDLMVVKAGSYGKLSKIVDLSLQVLEKRCGHVKFWEWFRALTVLQKQQSVPIQMLQRLWDLDTLQEARDVVESFAEVSVVQMTRNDEGSISLRLHDLVLDIAVRKVTTESERREFFRTLIRNYIPSEKKNEKDDALISAMRSTGDCGPQLPELLKRILKSNGAHRESRSEGIKKLGRSQHESKREIEEAVEGATEKASICSESFNAWWNVENDGYIHHNLCRILQNAGEIDQLLWLLSQPQWIVKRLVKDGIISLEKDMDHGIAMSNDNNSQDKNRREHLQMIALAARLGALFVSNNPCNEEAWFQLHGRLLWHAKQNKFTHDFVQRMESCAPKPWLRASEGLLQQAGSSALEAIIVPGTVLATRVEPDAIWTLSADNANVLRVGRCDRSKGYQNYGNLKWSKKPTDVFLPHASFLPDQLRVATAHIGGRICLWNKHTGILEHMVAHVCPHHLGFINFVADGTKLACQLKDYSIQLWNTLNGKPVGVLLQGHTGWVKSVALSVDGSRILSGSADMTVRLWNAENGNDMSLGSWVRGPISWLRHVSLNADGSRIESGLRDKTVRVWDAHIGEVVMEPLRGHAGSISTVTMSEEGARIESGSYDWTVRVSNVESGDALKSAFLGNVKSVNYMEAKVRKTLLKICSGDLTSREWDVMQRADDQRERQENLSAVWCVGVGFDGTRILSGFRDGTIRFWNARDGNEVGKPLLGHTDWVRCVTMSGDGTLIVSCSDDKTIRVWDGQSGDPVGQPLRGHTRSVRCLAVNANSSRIVSGSNDKTVRIWDIPSDDIVGKTLSGHKAYVGCVAISPDGARVVSGSGDHTLRVWNAESGAAVCEPLQGHTAAVWCVVLNADGTRIVSGSMDKTVRVWDAESGAAIGEPLEGHTTRVESVAISADGSLIVSEDGEMLRLWVLNADGTVRGMRTSRKVAWQRIIDSLELTWSTRRWLPLKRRVCHFRNDGSVNVLGTCEKTVDNIRGGDVYFTEFFKSCQIVR